jgi:imidazole glycerol phosphate synthase glutamine amidotransferase subunit
VIVTMIDYGAGNVTSVDRALRKLGVDVQTARQPQEIAAATCLVLPGVGHCAALLRSLDECALHQPLLDALSRGVPFLGICLGLQALYQSSQEAPAMAGLRVFPGCVQKLAPDVKLPHMGWDQLRATRPSRLLDGISPDAYFYFAHSYAAPADGEETAAVCCYGLAFAAVVEHKRIFGVQFHPEKSGAPGAQLLVNFLRLAA